MDYIKQIRKKIGSQPLFSPGVSIIVYENNKFLLQFRKDFQIWGLHGGSLELGETAQQAVRRELKEETNLDIVEMYFFNIYTGKKTKIIYPNGDIVYAIVMAFVVTKFKGTLCKQEKEINELKWFEEKEIPIKDMMQIDQMFLKDFLKNKNKKINPNII
ncbi:MAG: NUDIX domain-containing protein [Vigna little leaf phytoplasma]|nr:NUDIX domain-containing protein [Vigna little leaf phytoplasma]